MLVRLKATAECFKEQYKTALDTTWLELPIWVTLLEGDR